VLVACDLQAWLGDAGAIGKREVELTDQRLGRYDLELSSASPGVIFERVFLSPHAAHGRPVAHGWQITPDRSRKSGGSGALNLVGNHTASGRAPCDTSSGERGGTVFHGSLGAMVAWRTLCRNSDSACRGAAGRARCLGCCSVTQILRGARPGGTRDG